ncbi:Crp/Fnr family transcriptional regulator [Paenibacillus aurantius]|uniref:Crp/Fnr family transcriptional regulator n=1 Tax=Paenibacillus aurantius TaxID=2918900 RepID=A0AA96LCZ1_9BACL|nr:Crp/Fnr family transcriptional regulator [Paenibacillus aurantius]WNQ10913.1 Crp/Fnr family transcriptional regulator [Paenibacillus aurantius]
MDPKRITEQSVAGNTTAFSEQNLDRLKAIMYEHKVQAGANLFWEGDDADKLYFLKRGRIQITKATDEGKELILYVYESGDLLGQIDPFNDSKHSFSGVAVEDSVVGVLQQKDLEVLIWQHGDLAIEFMKWMGLTHRLTQTKFRDLMLYGKPGALCSTLIRLSNTYGKPEGENILITKKLTHSELSDMIGATRESVNRMLNDLKKQGVLDNENGYIVIKDLAYLQGICRCEHCPKDICRI